MTKRVLITGAGGPAGVNFTQSLRIAPETMCLVGTEANQYYTHLASTDRVYQVPKATDPAYIDQIDEIIAKEKIELIHPQPDIEVKAVSENRDKLKAATFLPSKAAIATCQDKFQSAKTWEKKGVPVAQTVVLTREADIERAFEKLGRPLWIRARRGAGGRGSTPASTPATASAWIRYWKSRHKDWEFIAQEYLRGRNIGFHSLWKEGELVTSMARERLQYIYPHLAPSGITGTPSVQRTVHDDKVNEVATEAILAIDQSFSGIACVDLKENVEGQPFATEINAGRMFTTSFFFSYASKEVLKNHSANFPYLYIQLAYRDRVPQLPKYNSLPRELYWIRHVDAPAKLVEAGKEIGSMYE